MQWVVRYGTGERGGSGLGHSAGALAGDGHSPLEMTVGQSTGCLEASRSSSAAQGHILLSIRGWGVGMGVGGVRKHLETRPGFTT